MSTGTPKVRHGVQRAFFISQHIHRERCGCPESRQCSELETTESKHQTSSFETLLYVSSFPRNPKISTLDGKAGSLKLKDLNHPAGYR